MPDQGPASQVEPQSLGDYLEVMSKAAFQSGMSFRNVSGLVLVPLAGYMPQAAYHHLLVLPGIAVPGRRGAAGRPARHTRPCIPTV